MGRKRVGGTDLITRLGKAIKVGLSSLALAAAGLAIGLDGGPAQAVTTTIFVSLAAQDVCVSPPTQVLSTVAIVGDAAPITLCVWVKDVTDPQGVGAFNVGFTYDGNLVTVQPITPLSSWLGSTGRLVFGATNGVCPDSEIDPNLPGGPPYAVASCSTTNYLPYGPQGMGLIAKAVVQPNSIPGLATLAFPPELTFLNDTGSFVGGVVTSPQPIPATVNGMNVRIAACADYNGDGLVLVADILYIVGVYGTDDGPADLDVNGIVLSPDIGISVMEYGRDCPT